MKNYRDRSARDSVIVTAQKNHTFKISTATNKPLPENVLGGQGVNVGFLLSLQPNLQGRLYSWVGEGDTATKGIVEDDGSGAVLEMGGDQPIDGIVAKGGGVSEGIGCGNQVTSEII